MKGGMGGPMNFGGGGIQCFQVNNCRTPRLCRPSRHAASRAHPGGRAAVTEAAISDTYTTSALGRCVLHMQRE